MRKLFGFLVLTALVLGVAGTALAEGGPIDPFSTRSSRKVKAMEGGTVDPFGTIGTMENGTIDPFSPTGK